MTLSKLHSHFYNEKYSKMTIPAVDLADFTSGEPVRKKKFVAELGKAFEEVGFVAVKNHGISADLIKKLYKNVQQFFSLPSNKKKNFEIPDACRSTRVYVFW